MGAPVCGMRYPAGGTYAWGLIGGPELRLDPKRVQPITARIATTATTAIAIEPGLSSFFIVYLVPSHQVPQKFRTRGVR